MIIFLRKIPPSTQLYELAQFVEPTLKGSIFQKTGIISCVKIFALHDQRNNTLEFHGLVTVEPDSVCKRLLRQLKTKRFKGKLIMVRQYVHRTWYNDQREFNVNLTTPKLLDRRRGCRRRGRDIEVVKDISEKLIRSTNYSATHPQ